LRVGTCRDCSYRGKNACFYLRKWKQFLGGTEKSVPTLEHTLEILFPSSLKPNDVYRLKCHVVCVIHHARGGKGKEEKEKENAKTFSNNSRVKVESH